MTRLKLKDWEGAELDSREAIDRVGGSDIKALKSFYNLAQALVGLRRPEEALNMVRIAYEWALETHDRSTEIMSQFILHVKKEIWRERESERLRDKNTTLRLIEEMLEQKRDEGLKELADQHVRGEIGEVGLKEEEDNINSEFRQRISHTRRAFADPGNPDTKERVVPDYLIDSMTFVGCHLFLFLPLPFPGRSGSNGFILTRGFQEIMHDPVVTPSGNSYEKTTLRKYLKDHPSDPLTREPLTEDDLIPNRALRECSETFLRDNGWAVDW